MGGNREKIIVVAGIGIVLVVIIMLLLPGDPKEPPLPQAELVVWGIFDSQAAGMSDAIQSYAAVNGSAKITYRHVDLASYEQELINALAAGQGPDIFMVHNTWLPKHFNKLVSATPEQFSLALFSELFPTVVVQDFTEYESVYASPIYIDTLALYYNKDIFDQAGVALTPKTWLDFQDAVAKIRKTNPITGDIIRAGAAMGGSAKSINRATDIISLLMMQYGASMVDESFSRAMFAGGSNSPGSRALDYYTKFANPATPYYTWNDKFSNSIDAFAEGRSAMLINYSYQAPVLRNKNPFLDFAVLPVPQFDPDKVVNYANYWGFGVAATSFYPEVAWDFIKFLTSDINTARAYMEKNSAPPALRFLINEARNDKDIGVFTRQSLTARSWYQPDNIAIENIFSDMIESVTTGRFGSGGALQKAAAEVTDLIKKSTFLEAEL